MPDQEEPPQPQTIGGVVVSGGDFRGSIVNIGSVVGGRQAIETLDRPRIFLSYSWNDDKPFVERLDDDLTALGFTVWRDVRNMQSRGAPTTVEQCREINDCDRFVPVIGPAAFVSQAVQEEWTYVRKTCKAVTVVRRLGEEIPPDFGDPLYFDFRDDARYAEMLHALADRLRVSEHPAELHGDFRDLPAGVITREEFDRLDAVLRLGETNAAITGKSAALHAPGGIGKSVLATLFAHDCRTRRHFTHGIFWLEIGKTPNITSLQARLGVLLGDAPDSAKYYTDVKTGRDRLAQRIGRRRVLIILDDVWEPAHVEAFKVAADNCRWLATTRKTGLGARLGLGRDQVIPLDKLSAEQGLALINGVLGIAAEADHPERALHSEIVRELDGHTQAIAVAAAKLRPDLDGLSAREWLDRFRADRDSLNPLGELQLEGEDRELNLERSFKVSYDDLSEADQARFRALGAFAPDGAFSAAAAAAVFEADERTARDALNRLVGASLLDRAGERYSQHNLLRAYAQALLRRADEENTTRERHFRYYAAEYGDHDRNVPYAADGRHATITAAFDNIRRALAWGFDHLPREACDLVLGLQNSYLQLAQPVELRLELLEKSRDVAGAIGYVQGFAYSLKDFGDVQNFRDDRDAALESYEAALGLFRAVGDRLGEANTLKAIGDVQNFRDDRDAALASYEAALGLFRAVGARLGEANTLEGLGVLLLNQGKAEEGGRLLNEALALHRAIGNKPGQANIYFRVALMLWQNGSLKDAEPLLAEAVAIGNQIDPNHPVTVYFTERLNALRAEIAAQH